MIASLERYAALQPEAAAYVDEHGVVSYGQLWAAARRGAGWLARMGVRAGDTVAISLDTGAAPARRGLELCYAAGYLGAVLLPLFPDVPQAACLDLLRRHGANWLLVGGAPPSVAGARTLDPVAFDAADVRFDRLPAVRGDRPDGGAVYFFTSGTTAGAKAVLFNHAQWHGNSLAGARSIGMRPGDRQMAAIAWPSGLAMRYLCRAHAGGAAFVAALFDDTREGLARTLARYGVNRLSASPWQVRRLLASPPHALPPLASLHVIGAFFADAELAQARVALTPNVYVGYGSNELGAVTLLGPGEAAAGSVGRLIEGIEGRVTDAQGRVLAPGETGELSFRAPWLGNGYAGNDEVTRERFRDGWFYPGDIGGIDAEGRVYLRGRTGEVINYGGLKIWPEEVEAVLKRHPALADAAVCGLPDAMAGQVAVAFIVSHHYFTEEGVRAFCAAHLEAARVPLHFVVVDAIPRNEGGKILRERLVASYGPGLRARTPARA